MAPYVIAYLLLCILMRKTGLGIWNDFQKLLLLGQVKTITVGIYRAIGSYSTEWGIAFAYVLFADVPVAILYLFA